MVYKFKAQLNLQILICFLMLNNAFSQQKALFLVAGQSNAVGQGDSVTAVKCSPNTAFEYRFTDDTLVHLQDPVGAKELSFEKAGKGSICPAFAQKYAELTKKQVIIVAAARGGASCHVKAELDNYGTWDKTGRLQLFEKAVQKTEKALAKTGVKLNGIIWLQGERDANAINSKNLTVEEYQQALEDLIKRFRAKFGRKIGFYIVQTGYYTDHPKEGFDQVRQAQKNVAQKLKRTYIVYENTHQFKEKGWLKDLIHYNQAALNDIGETVAKGISR